MNQLTKEIKKIEDNIKKDNEKNYYILKIKIMN